MFRPLLGVRFNFKSISLLLIIAYFQLPTLCYADPCELYKSSASEIIDLSANQQITECLEQLDPDNCETTCCCARHVPLSTFAEVFSAHLEAKLVPDEPHLALPRLMDRILSPLRTFPETTPACSKLYTQHEREITG